MSGNRNDARTCQPYDQYKTCSCKPSDEEISADPLATWRQHSRMRHCLLIVLPSDAGFKRATFSHPRRKKYARSG